MLSCLLCHPLLTGCSSPATLSSPETDPTSSLLSSLVSDLLISLIFEWFSECSLHIPAFSQTWFFCNDKVSPVALSNKDTGSLSHHHLKARKWCSCIPDCCFQAISLLSCLSRNKQTTPPPQTKNPVPLKLNAFNILSPFLSSLLTTGLPVSPLFPWNLHVFIFILSCQQL